MKISPIRAAAVLSLVVLAATSSAAFAQQQAEGRVISSSPLRMADGSTAYAVTYDYNGSRYSTRTASPPGATIALQVDSMGVSTVETDGNYASDNGNYAGNGAPAASGNPWQNVTPEPGVVVSGRGAAPVGAPVYMAPAPVYVQPPVYVAPAYPYPYYGGYGYGYGYPPVGVSLNFGYSRGWGGGYYRGGYRGWR